MQIKRSVTKYLQFVKAFYTFKVPYGHTVHVNRISFTPFRNKDLLHQRIRGLAK